MRFIDGAQARTVRDQLRRPKRDAPGLTHALHYLFDAYKQLEAENERLANFANRIKRDVNEL